MIRLTYDKARQLARLETDSEDSTWGGIYSLLSNYDLDDFEPGNGFLQLPWWDFKGKWTEVKEWLDYHEVQVEISEEAKNLLEQDNKRTARTRKYTEEEIETTLPDRGFARTLRPFQLRNVTKLANLPLGAATFSVPGSGKTTEALACYFLKKDSGTRLFVICPKNAFGVWEEEIKQCAPDTTLTVTRLTGPTDEISKKLSGDGNVFLTTYQKLSNEVSNLAAVLDGKDMMFLDESHYIKKGPGGAWAEAVLRLSHLPGFKLIMTGTPLPNSSKDLESQFQFIGVYLDSEEDDLAEEIEPFYVRTTKDQLGIRPYEPVLRKIPLGNAQLALYQFAKSEDQRQFSNLRARDRNTLRRMGNSAMRLLQISSNPTLLARHAFEDLAPIRDALAEGPGPKFSYVCNRARKLASMGRKCVIWSHFVLNVETIAANLADLGADFIHGGVEADPRDKTESREAKIKRFHEDEQSMVLVANPAACAEAISLHTVCHDAIYLDRNFNAAQFLQSIDRIHRLGLDPGVSTNVEILCSADTIDEIVHDRLISKVQNMERVLGNASIQPEVEETDLDEDGFNEEDSKAFWDHLSENE